MMHQSIATIDSPEFINLQPLEINPLMSSCDIKVLYLGENRNHSYITKDVATEMAKTLRGAPIVGYFKEEKQDFADHGERIIFDDEGIKFECMTKPYGFVAPDAKVWFQKFEDTDEFGNKTTREYLMTQTIVKDVLQTDYKSFLNACDVSEQYTFVQKKAENYTIELDEGYRNQMLYLTFDIVNVGDYLNNKDISITINGVKNKLTAKNELYYNGNNKFDFVIPLEDTTELRIEITKGKYDIRNLKMYTSDMIYSKYEEVDALKVDEGKGIISYTTEATKGEYLVTSFPYDKGFTATVNGEKTEIEVVNKAFVGIRLKEGKNDIVIKYKAPLFVEGVFVSIFGVLLLLFGVFKEWFGNTIAKYYKKHREIILYLVFGVLTTVVSLITYFVCTRFFLDATNAMELQLANIISWIISVLFAYVTNRKHVFQSRGKVGQEMAKFYLSRVGTLGIDMFLMYLLVTAGCIQDGIAKVIVQVFVIVANYILGKLLVFKGECK